MGLPETWVQATTLFAQSDGHIRPWVFLLIAAAVALFSYTLSRSQPTNFPFANGEKGSLLLLDYKRKKSFVQNARQLLTDGFAKFNGPFNLATDSRPMIILGPEMIDAVNAENALSFKAHVEVENLSAFFTFRTMRTPPEGMFEEAVIKGLTRALPKFTKPLSLEMTACLNDSWATRTTWHEVRLMDDILAWVARLSTCIFLEPTFGKNEEWLKISTSYTVNLFTAIAVTKFFPTWLRPFVDWVSPLNRTVRRDYRTTASILAPVLKARKAEIEAAKREGRTPNLPDDSIEWFRNASRGRKYDDTDVQLALAVAAIHTTSDLLCQAVLNLCAHPEYVEPLRREAVEVLQKHGLRKTALTELRLLDSFFKETQRLKPINMTSMHRRATSTVELPGGFRINKGEHTAISSHQMWNPAEYEDPDVFDAFRFVRRRQQPGLEMKSQLVSTSPEHLGFAHGKHACPGRFFAANEVKIAMLHLLLKYDMAMDDPAAATPVAYGFNLSVNTAAKIRVKSRQPELDLDMLANAL